MSYTIYYSDPAKFSYPIIVQDDVKYNGVGTGGLTLVGRNYPAYGQAVAENLIHILENSASTVPPVNPIEGQLWYDSGTRKLRINDGAANNANWKPINGVFQQDTEPTNVIVGDIWVDTLTLLVRVYTGTEFKLIGIQNSGATETGAIPVNIEDNSGSFHDVILMTVGGTVVEVIAKEAFTPKEVIAGFTTLSIGVNLAASSTLNGVARSANLLNYNGELVAGNRFLKNDVSQTINGQFAITQDSNALKIGTDPTFILERDTSGVTAKFVNTFKSYGSFTFNTKNSSSGNIQVLSIGGNPQQVFVGDPNSSAVSTPATSTSTGALVVKGGVGIGGDVYISGQLNLTNTSNTLTVANVLLTSTVNAISTTTGALRVPGGVGIGKNLHVGGDLYLSNRLYDGLGKTGVSGQVLVTGSNGNVFWTAINTGSYTGGTIPNAVMINYDLNSTASNTGTLVVNGGVGIAKDVYIGGGVTATSVTINGTQITTASMIAGVAVSITNTTTSVSTLTGALKVAGGVGIRGDLYVGGNIFGSKLTIDETIINSTVIQTGDQFTITNVTNASSTVTGALRVTGGVGIGKDLRVGGNVYSLGGSPLVNFNTGTLVAQASYAVTATNAAYAYSFNTGTLVTTATTAQFISTPAGVGRLGGVKIAGGSNVTIDANGTIDVAAPYVLVTATTVLLGGVRIGNNITVSSNGTISVAAPFTLSTATVDVLGGIKIGSGFTVDGDGTLNVATITNVILQVATTSTIGGVKVLGDTPDIIVEPTYGDLYLNHFTTVTSGLSYNLDWNTTSTRWINTYGLTTATATSLGGVRIGTGLTASGTGTVSVNTSTLVATAVTALSINTSNTASNAIVKTNTGYNVAYDTVVTLDNLQARVTTAGVAQVKALTTIMNAYWSAQQMVSGVTTSSTVVNTGVSLATGAWTAIGTANNLNSGGDTIVAILQDQDAQKIYRVTYVHTAGVSSASAVIERLI